MTDLDLDYLEDIARDGELDRGTQRALIAEVRRLRTLGNADHLLHQCSADAMEQLKRERDALTSRVDDLESALRAAVVELDDWESAYGPSTNPLVDTLRKFLDGVTP